MVCLFLLPVIAKITTDCLILIGYWKVSLNLIGCLKKLSHRTKWSTPLDCGGSGLSAGAHKKFVPFFWTHFISWQSVHWKGFPVAQICPNSHKIVSSSMWAFPVAEICSNLHKIVSSCIRAFPVAEIRPNSHKIVSSCIRAFPVAQIRPNSHKIVSSCTRAFPVAQIRPNSHKIVFSCKRAFLVAQIRPNSHKIVSSYLSAFPVAQICQNLHKNRFQLHKSISSHTDPSKLA